MKPFLFSIITLLLAAAFTPPASHAQDETPTAPAPETTELTPEEIARRIPVVEQNIAAREERAVELTNDMIRLDNRIEDRIDTILGLLKSMKDSNQSGTRVTRMKQDAIAGLDALINYYDQKRRDLKLEAFSRDPKIEREQLFASMAVFDERIEKRVEQILSLAKTFTEHKDYNKYIYGRSSRGRWGGRSRHRNPAYQQNRKQTIQTNQTRQELSDALRRSIDDIDRRNRDIRETLKKDITDQYRQLLDDELAQNEELIELREAQIIDLAQATGGGGRAVSTNAAMSTEDIINDLADDIESDFQQLFNLYDELTSERTNLKFLEQRLQDAKEYLESRDAK